MGIGTMGVVRAADVSIDDISMYYTYSPNRQTTNSIVYPLNPAEILTYNYLPNDEQIVGNENLLEGLYNMRLPASIFNQIGIYTVYIKPKSYTTVIVDCSVLSSLPSVKGIVLDTNTLPTNLKANNALQGYRIEYINSDGTKLRNVIRYCVTSNKTTPVAENIGNTSQKAVRYRFDDAGTLMFLQVTPSSSSDVKPNVNPFIGTIGQTITLTNTFFSPLAIEVELVKSDIDSVMNIIAGSQIKSVSEGLLTLYDDNSVITNQFDLYTLKEEVTGEVLYEIKQVRSAIDSSQDFNQITTF